jgi:DNA-binding protein HU-beta
MTKQEFIEVIAKRVEKQDVGRGAVRTIVDATFEEMIKAIKKEKRFAVPGFGTFTVRNRKAKTGRNPKTGEAIKIKASRTVGFKPAPAVKESL